MSQSTKSGSKGRSSLTRKTNSTWGGKRAGAGRPPLTVPRCACGKHTLERAQKLRLKCRIEGRNAKNESKVLLQSRSPRRTLRQ